MGCVSSQETYETSFLESVEINTTENIVYAKQPSYKELIPPAAARRMAKGVKMGLAASTKALKEANVEVPDAIITGTGMGCIEDSEKFLKALIDNNEEYLTPTNFIQSTHNTVGAQIALGLGCKGYNFTYVNGSISFESALLDAKLQLENEEENTILVGAADETSSHTMEVFKLVNIIKKESDLPYSVLDSNSSGVVYSEGATFVTLENVKKENSYAVLEALQIQNELNIDEVESFITSFLDKNHLKIHDIDVVVLGNNGDIKVDVTFTDAEIKEVKIVEHAETPGLSDGAIEKVPAAIIEKQSTEVDTIAGATVTSKAIIEAVNAAITEATK